MNVGDFMNENPPRIGMKATLAEALQMMADNKTRHIVVIDEGRDIAGILSDRDLAMYYDPVNMSSERWQGAWLVMERNENTGSVRLSMLS